MFLEGGLKTCGLSGMTGTGRGVGICVDLKRDGMVRTDSSFSNASSTGVDAQR